MGLSASKTGIRVEAPEATSLSVDGPASLEVGQTVTYAAVVTSADGSTTTATDVEWASSNTTVATVDAPSRHLTPTSMAVTTTRIGTCKMVGSPFLLAISRRASTSIITLPVGWLFSTTV